MIPLYVFNQSAPNTDKQSKTDTEEQLKEESADDKQTSEKFNEENNEDVNTSSNTDDKSNDTEQNSEKNEELAEENGKETSSLEELKHYVIKDISDDEIVVYGAVPDQQGQYVIPISFIGSKGMDINEYYNKMEQLIQEAGINDSNYLLKGFNYSIDTNEHQATLDVPSDFSLSSSTEAYLFEIILGKMFIPLGINQVSFSSDVDLGPIGKVNELQLQTNRKENYKIYDNQFLIPIPLNEEISIDNAISDMSISDKDFNLTKTIPDEITFSSETEGSKLVITFENSPEMSNQALLTMLEAIMLTAKSFGFELVEFDNTSIQQIGDYNLKKPIQVPISVNPIILK